MPNTFITTRKGREKLVYIAQPWESVTLIDQGIADGRETDVISRTGDLITIVCRNGSATYGISGFDVASRSYFLDLVRSSYEEPPAHVRRGMT